MPIDFSKLSSSVGGNKPIDPIQIFQQLRVSDPQVKDLWLGQGDALRDWHANRALEDVAIVLNTGAGKTLVALLAAQSLVNETNGHVVYACSTNQLVEQTAAKAAGYGLQVSTYYEGKFSNDLYKQGLAVCITNYQAIFNGKSKFFKHDLSGIIFDDAHAAEHIIRNQFTLSISKDEFPEAFNSAVELFRPFFTRINVQLSYEETFRNQDSLREWFVPPFAIRENIGTFTKLLSDAQLSKNVRTLFVWEYLRDRVDVCAVFMTNRELSITPAAVPVGTLSYFEKGIRRLYLSATLSANDSFLRTFGRLPKATIAPKTNAGECERLIIIPARNKDCKSDTDLAKTIVAKKKALILVPTYRRAEAWQDVTKTVDTDKVAGAIDTFRQSPKPEKLILVARYDGVDLPGDTCRLMVIDDLPSSVSPIERYLWEWLGLGVSLRSTIASRIVQSFGRISRGSNDYGVVVLTGKRLTDWLLSPKNRAALPTFLQQQIELAKELAEGSSCNDLVESADQCLSRERGWIAYYESKMKMLPAISAQIADEETLGIAKREVSFGKALWERDYKEAARELESGLEQTFGASRNTGAWHSLWLGYAYELLGDTRGAHELYRRAHSVAKNIPPFELQTAIAKTAELPQQVIEVSRYLDSGPQLRKQIPGHFDLDLKSLDGSGTPKQTEEAVRVLGEYLGLSATRPDNEFGTGPDVLWDAVGGPAFSIELKTGKLSGPAYGKSDLYQWPDHIQWVKENSDSSTILSAFIGPLLPPSPKANPSDEMIVIELNEFKKVADVLRAALQDICARALPITLRETVFEVFREKRLLWPDLYSSLAKHKLKEIPKLGTARAVDTMPAQGMDVVGAAASSPTKLKKSGVT